MQVGMICTGNICRSPMAEVVLQDMVASDPQLRGQVHVSSAGTANWHVGRPMDPRASAALERAGYDPVGTTAAFADAHYLGRLDLIVVTTREHRDDVRQRLGGAGNIRLLRSYLTPEHDLDLADPYYGDGGAFDECLATIIQSCRVLAQELRPAGAPSST